MQCTVDKLCYSLLIYICETIQTYMKQCGFEMGLKSI